MCEKVQTKNIHNVWRMFCFQDKIDYGFNKSHKSESQPTIFYEKIVYDNSFISSFDEASDEAQEYTPNVDTSTRLTRIAADLINFFWHLQMNWFLCEN